MICRIPDWPYAKLPKDRRTRWRMKFLWQNSNPRKVIAIHDLMSAGKKTSVRSLMIISRSLSKNSRTRLRFVFEENTSMSWRWVGVVWYERTCKEKGNHLDDILVVQLTKILDFANGRHVEAIFELPDFYLFDGDLLRGRHLVTYRCRIRSERVRECMGKRRTSVDHGIGAFTDFLIFGPVARPRRSRRHTRARRQVLPFSLAFCIGLFDGIH